MADSFPDHGIGLILNRSSQPSLQKTQQSEALAHRSVVLCSACPASPLVVDRLGHYGDCRA
jgi:hypothetical protein